MNVAKKCRLVRKQFASSHDDNGRQTMVESGGSVVNSREESKC